MYSLRLQALRDRVESAVRAKLGPKVPILKVADLDNVGDNKSVCVIGTLMKNQVRKPSILKEIGEESAKSNENPDLDSADCFVDDSDELVLEDEVQRARLYFSKDQENFRVSQFVNGVVVGVHGHLVPVDAADGGGKFKVSDIVYPEPAPQANNPLPAKDRYVILMSGIELSCPTPVAALGKYSR